MTTTTTDFAAVSDALRSNERFLVVTHENPDGDALGSMLGATLGLRALGKDVLMHLAGDAPLPGEFGFLPLGELRRELPDDLEERVLLAVDCANQRRISPTTDATDRARLVIDVDHHHDNNRFGAAVAEVDHHDLWQRCALTVAFVARDAHEAQQLAGRAEAWLAAQEWELVRAEQSLVSPEDEAGI